MLKVPDYLVKFLEDWDRAKLAEEKAEKISAEKLSQHEQLLRTPNSESKKSITSRLGDPPTTPVSLKAAKLLGIDSKLLDLKNVSTPPPHDFSVGVNCIKKELKLGPYVNVGDIFGKESTVRSKICVRLRNLVIFEVFSMKFSP